MHTDEFIPTNLLFHFRVYFFHSSHLSVDARCSLIVRPISIHSPPLLALILALCVSHCDVLLLILFRQIAFPFVHHGITNGQVN